MFPLHYTLLQTSGRWRWSSTTGGSLDLGRCPTGLLRLQSSELAAGLLVVLGVDRLADEDSWDDS